MALRPSFDERAAVEDFNRDPQECLALHLATGKAASIFKCQTQELVIGADQTLHCGEILHHKPRNLDEARQQLKQLRGKAHILTTAVTCMQNNQIKWQHIETATITMRDYSDQALNQYLENSSETILHSVGSYQYEGTGIQLMETVLGDYHTILGFPILPLMGFLRRGGYVAA